MFHVNIVMFHVNIVLLHVDIAFSHVDIFAEKIICTQGVKVFHHKNEQSNLKQKLR